MGKITGWVLIPLLTATAACSPRNGVTDRTAQVATAPQRITRLLEPAEPLTVPVGSEIHIRVGIPDSVKVDSVQLLLGGTLKETYYSGGASDMAGGTDQGGSTAFTLSSAEAHTGISSLRARVFLQNGESENLSQQITFLSDLEPQLYSYRVLNEFAHDPAAYTQGLQYVDGSLYEGTGNRGASSLRKVELETGKILQMRDLDASLFGEGITVFGDRIYQVTYTSQVGFIYDRSTFEQIQKVYYQNREGWGLTHNGQELIMSDGTHILYFLDPGMFTVNHQIEVYDQEGPVEDLNELEYIQGKIWANRYYTDEIVIIDPVTGKVEGRINLKGILKTADREPTTDVLNGIAWDAAQNRIFVTGKYWPKLFEIRIVPLTQ